MLDDLKLFTLAVEEASLTAAAERLETTVATVSRRLSALERQLGCKLLHRSPRGLTLTQEGETYYNECAELIQALDQRLGGLDKALHSLAGPLKVLAPTNLAVGPLDPFWPDFIRQYPKIELTLDLNNATIDLKQAQADLAVRIGPQADSTLIQKRLGHIDTVLVTSPSMDQPLPERIDQLLETPTVATGQLNQWQLSNRDGESQTLRKKHSYISNDLMMAINLVKGGAGVTLAPLNAVYPLLQSGELVQLLPHWQGQRRELYLVWPYRRSLSARARVLMEQLTDFLQQQPWFNPIDLR
ncbi:LysR family transcriptional regulator [Marinobacterium arenosum]|uniref:LysR family transcriptional regulator n=1 Tax=Marinobacterium arenosum TaxID=2862496 RepID=UPI001C9428A9|nr:LysR family transcriptional regulator [Marinobacterium arenosum]MBY4676453.1 LysR family transcriptional regulator [Marinobacterium arenosum]